MFQLDEKVALVTGGSTGIGFETAKSLGEAGAKVAIASIGLESLKRANKELNDLGIESVCHEVDVTNKTNIKNWIDDIISIYGQIDILVNGAGINIRKPLMDIEEDDWERVLDVNLKGTFLVGQAVIKEMIKKKQGRIINISSVFGADGGEYQTSYAASKGGVNQITKVWAAEFGVHGITVNAIAPGYIRTPLTEKWLSDQERHNKIIEKTMIKRVGTVEDLAGPMVFLASDASKYMTGQTMYVDGGWTAH